MLSPLPLRNRWRQMQLNEMLRYEVTPKNILMIGPTTDVGKTKIVQRLAKLANAPFIKINATKFTEVVCVGKNKVDSIIRDLTDAIIKMVRIQSIEKNHAHAEELAEECMLDVLIILPAENNYDQLKERSIKETSAAHQTFRKELCEGQLDDAEIELYLIATTIKVEIIASPSIKNYQPVAVYVLKPR